MLMPRWNREREDEDVPVTLSIKYVPDHVAQRLRERAARHHRSLQGELLAIVEEAALHDQSPGTDGARVSG
jgi:antitoxin FitA